jgi:hypothetical protein
MVRADVDDMERLKRVTAYSPVYNTITGGPRRHPCRAEIGEDLAADRRAPSSWGVAVRPPPHPDRTPGEAAQQDLKREQLRAITEACDTKRFQPRQQLPGQ